MKKFVKEFLTNRFGIVTAALNICYFVSAEFVRPVFAHQHGEICFYYKEYFLLLYSKAEFAGFGFLVNLPSLMASFSQGASFLKMFPDACPFTHLKVQIIFSVFFVAFQWLFIGWASKKIAEKIRRNQFSGNIAKKR